MDRNDSSTTLVIEFLTLSGRLKTHTIRATSQCLFSIVLFNFFDISSEFPRENECCENHHNIRQQYNGNKIIRMMMNDITQPNTKKKMSEYLSVKGHESQFRPTTVARSCRTWPSRPRQEWWNRFVTFGTYHAALLLLHFVKLVYPEYLAHK